MFTIEELIYIKNSLAERQDEHALGIQNKINEFFTKVHTNPGLCLWRFWWDCGRMGELEGLFKATTEEIESLIGEEICFGEVLGKHSDIYGVIEWDDIELVSDNPLTVATAAECGYNPLNYLDEE